jgi:hypothetical protein
MESFSRPARGPNRPGLSGDSVLCELSFVLGLVSTTVGGLEIGWWMSPQNS